MQVEIYADVVFFINFIMDFFIFWIVSKLYRRKTNYIRIFLGSALAALFYCLLIFIFRFNIILNILAALFILSISIFVCFNPKNIKEFFKLMLLTNASAFAVGGAGIAIFYFTNITNIMGNLINFNIKGFSFKILLSSTCIVFIIIKLFIKYYQRIIIKKQSFCKVKIFYEDAFLELNALIDTGNSLHEPISHKPVIVAEFMAVKELLPDAVKLIYYEKKDDDLNMLLESLSNEEEKIPFRMIPFSSLGRQNGMLIGFVVNRAEIDSKDKLVAENVIIAVYNYKLSKDGAYNALLNPEFLDV